MKKIIYDFDGTLTTSPIAYYPALKLCNINNVDEWKDIIYKKWKDKSVNFVEHFFNLYFNILKENNLPLNDDTFLIGKDELEYSPGVIEYFKQKDSDVKSYILTSNYESWVKNSIIGKYVDEVYGTSFKYENGILTGIRRFMSEIDKIEKIDMIANNNYENVIYIGDGLTDIHAFKHIINKGGTAVLVYRPNNYSVCNALKEENIKIDCFLADFTKGSKLYNFLKELPNISQD